jgi:MYXO-CTERM domain-containing protein
VEVRTTDGINIGTPQRLTLNGDNPVVDRRSMVFNAKEPAPKKVADSTTGAPQTEGSYAQSAEVAPSGSAAPFIPQDAYQKTPEEEVKTRPAGCGCVTAGAKTGGGLGGVAFGLTVVAARRRRRRQQREA